jgi:hypothetical protein
MIRGWPSSGVWALVLSIPNNGITVLLLSDRLSMEGGHERWPLDLCTL